MFMGVALSQLTHKNFGIFAVLVMIILRWFINANRRVIYELNFATL